MWSKIKAQQPFSPTLLLLALIRKKNTSDQIPFQRHGAKSEFFWFKF
jgi:hypothetical protein